MNFSEVFGMQREMLLKRHGNDILQAKHDEWLRGYCFALQNIMDMILQEENEKYEYAKEQRIVSNRIKNLVDSGINPIKLKLRETAKIRVAIKEGGYFNDKEYWSVFDPDDLERGSFYWGTWESLMSKYEVIE